MARVFTQKITEDGLAQEIYDVLVRDFSDDYWVEEAIDRHENGQDVKSALLVAGKPPLETLTQQVRKDLSKVVFDTENLEHSSGVFMNTQLGGFHTLANGLTFLGITAGGDWETPIFFIIYWDGKKLRGYIPKEGNTWNTNTKEALGNAELENDGEEDTKFLVARFPEKAKELIELHGEDSYEVGYSLSHEMEFNDAELIEDIKNRIQYQD